MTIRTVCGPLSNEKDAQETAKQMGENCSVFSRYLNDNEGYITDQQIWFVEQDDSILSGKTFGYDTAALMARQYR